MGQIIHISFVWVLLANTYNRGRGHYHYLNCKVSNKIIISNWRVTVITFSVSVSVTKISGQLTKLGASTELPTHLRLYKENLGFSKTFRL